MEAIFGTWVHLELSEKKLLSAQNAPQRPWGICSPINHKTPKKYYSSKVNRFGFFSDENFHWYMWPKNQFQCTPQWPLQQTIPHWRGSTIIAKKKVEHKQTENSHISCTCWDFYAQQSLTAGICTMSITL